ncbi:hypothetical protein SCRM01_172 [Synechococcus phage S-CRM01]|uniref:hypothetical protein n=1 Tax=Synechococcus phage S-CRM01 TaxID=1026955 RepID=UPI000209E3FD|nr:hypothetical protein SCRM01_172 [Synechococcus phage S-CRM01]AEC53118.1 hypothetical protein SCRM01_172 [Synechococcus phage S-CRM01]
MAKFKVGDHVRRGRGTKPAVVTSVGYCIYCRYLESRSTFSAYESDLVLLDEYEVNSLNTMNSTLYTFKENDVDVYASVIGKTEAGLLVLEVRGGGGIFTKSPSDVTEVVPYTVSINFNGIDSHYEVPKGLLAKGDVLLRDDGKFGTVVELDTKKKNANSKLVARRVLTEELSIGS